MITKKMLLILMLLIFLSSISLAQRKVYDYGNLTAEDIEELRQKPNPCAEMKSRRMEGAIKQRFLNNAVLEDGNQADYDVLHYGIDISLNFGSQSIAGHVDYLLKSLVNGLNAVDLNLIDQLIVDSITVNGMNTIYNHSVDLLTITTPTTFDQGDEFAMAVYYHGQPYSGYGYTDGGMGFDVHGGYNICWTATEPWGSRNWWPCKDTPSDKADSIDIIIEYPSSYDLASNGVIVEEEDLGGGRKRTHYKSNYPIVTYLVAISCADFVIETKTWNYQDYSMPVYSYTLPNAYESREVFDTLTLTMLNHYSDAFGVYPFVEEKLANANCGVYGTMEHQTCSFHDPFAWYYDNVYLLIHENGHQWWGDMITCETFNHIWLNEGFTTWTEAIFYERQFGMAAYHQDMSFKKYLGGGTVYVEDVMTDVIFDGNLSYNKGSWVVHMLRGVLGDSTFFEAIHAWYGSEFQYGTATTEDLSAVVSNSVGMSMNWFFNQWIYGNAHPKYEISWMCEPDSTAGYNLYYFVEQAQQTGTYFKMPVKTTFVTTGGNFDTTLWNNGLFDGYTLWFPDSVTNVIFDPQEWILRTVSQIPFSMHIITRTVPDGEVGNPYFQRLEAAGGVPPYYWVMLGGDMPSGLVWEGDTLATISGVPIWPATYYFEVQVTDSDSPPKSEIWSYALIINEESQYVAGDADGSGAVDIADAVFIISYIFSGGPAPEPLQLGDADCSGAMDITDSVYLITYIFSGGPAPSEECW